MNNTSIVKKSSELNKKNGLIFSIFFLIITLGIGLFTLNRSFKVNISDQHPALNFKHTSNSFIKDQGISDILEKHNIKRISLTFTDQIQKTFSQTFDEPNNPYTSHSFKLENDTLFITIHINSEILKSYNWSDEQISLEAFYHVFVALYDLDHVKKEDTLSHFKAYIDQNGQVPFLISHDN